MDSMYSSLIRYKIRVFLLPFVLRPFLCRETIMSRRPLKKKNRKTLLLVLLVKRRQRRLLQVMKIVRRCGRKFWSGWRKFALGRKLRAYLQVFLRKCPI